MINLWGRTNSSNVKKVVWCLEELQLPYKRIDAGGTFGGLDTPEYLQMNPNGVIPTIDDQGFILWESNTIMRYLANRYQGEKLYPMDATQRALVDQWLDWCTSTLFAPYRAYLTALLRTPPEQRNPREIKALQQQLTRYFQIVDHQLQKNEYCAGAQLTLADIALVCYSYGWFNLPGERQSMLHLERWYQQMSALPLFNKVVKVPL
ncbi:MAG: glutathione S-transferase family protein [Enterobacteriaceae bacterium]